MGYKKPDMYTIVGGISTSNPIDATLYYAGEFGGSASLQTTNTTRRNIVPRKGIIREVYLASYSATAAGTGEAWEWSLLNITTTGETVIQSQSIANASRTWSNTNLGLAVNAGDAICFKTTTPTWVTNPEGFVAYYIIVIECE